MDLQTRVNVLRADLINRPCPSLILAARHIQAIYQDAPDWVGALAGCQSADDFPAVRAYVLKYELELPGMDPNARSNDGHVTGWNSEAGRASPLVSLFFLACVACLIGLASLVSMPMQAAPAFNVVIQPQDQATLADDLLSVIDEKPAELPDTMALVQPASTDYTRSHGLEHHGVAAQKVRDCMANKGPAMTWLDTDGFRLQICQLDTKEIGMQVETQAKDGHWRSVTEYIKNRFNSLKDISNWLYRCGARPVR